MNETVNSKPEKLIFKEFDEFPNAFEDLEALKPLEYLQFLISIIDLYNKQIEELNKKFEIIDVNKIKRFTQDLIAKEGEKRIGAIDFKDIINLLFIIIRFQINIRDSETIEEENGNNVPMLFFLRKYIRSLELVANKKFEVF